MGLFDSDEVKRKQELERCTKLYEEARRKKCAARARLKAEKKREKKMERLREISNAYGSESPYALSSGSTQADKNTPPMSLNRGLGNTVTSYNKQTFSTAGGEDSASSKGNADQGLPKLDRW